MAVPVGSTDVQYNVLVGEDGAVWGFSFYVAGDPPASQQLARAEQAAYAIADWAANEYPTAPTPTINRAWMPAQTGESVPYPPS